MANGLDAVAIGVAQERGVIGRVVIAQSGRAIVAAAGLNAGVPERIDLGSPLRLEAPMAARAVLRFRTLVDRDVHPVRIRRARPLAITEPVLAAADLDHPERLHDRVIEALGGGKIGYGNGTWSSIDQPRAFV